MGVENKIKSFSLSSSQRFNAFGKTKHNKPNELWQAPEAIYKLLIENPSANIFHCVW